MHSSEHELRILIADRPGPARSALAHTLAALDDVVVLGAEGSACDLGYAMRALRPDVVVIDDRILGDWHEPYDGRVLLVVVGVDDDPAYAARAGRRHAVAWLSKECAGDDLERVLHEIRDRLSRRTPPAPVALHGGSGSPL